MSTIEMKDRLHAIIDRHAENEAWLTRIFEILESAEPVSNDNWWNQLTPEEQAGLDEADRQLDAGESCTNDEVMAKVKEWIKR